MNALFLKDLASKIRRGQRGRITSGFSAGGLSYGYQEVRELDGAGNVVRGKRSVKESEAAVVRRIFMEYVSGKSPRRIAAELNADGIPSPRGGQWNASTINGHWGRRNGILQNELYKGQLIHNRVRMLRDPDTGRRISRVNPETEWIRVEVPELKIVSDELRSSVQQTRRRCSGQPAQNCRRAKRLLSGLLTLESVVVRSRSSGPESMAAQLTERREPALMAVKCQWTSLTAVYWLASKYSFETQTSWPSSFASLVWN